MNTGDFYDLDDSFKQEEEHGDPFCSSVFDDYDMDGILVPPNEMLMDAGAATTTASTGFASAFASEFGGGSGTPATPNSPATSSSNDVAAEYGKEGNLGKDCGDGSDQSKKTCKATKRGGKRQRQERFAFATKSDVDHLEDGYRWRKYGQKAVKNSSYPRSYYRCTTPKCPVKKRVERSYQDPSTVITTYEGKHTHPSPINLRSAGNSNLIFKPPEPATTTTTTRFPQDGQFLIQQDIKPMLIHSNVDDAKDMSSGTFDLFFDNISSSSPSPLHHLRDQFPPNHGLLQDVVHSLFRNNQQP